MLKIFEKNLLHKKGSDDRYNEVIIVMDQSNRDALRNEINADRIPRRHRCQYEYDIKSIVINKAIQDVGMGRYNWNLFFLCGIGWLSDKYVYLNCSSTTRCIKLIVALTQYLR